MTRLRQMMKHRRKPLHLVLDRLPAHHSRSARDYAESCKGRPRLHLLPGYGPDMSPDEVVWGHNKRNGVARHPLRARETLAECAQAQLADIAARPELARSFCRHPSVAYITDRYGNDLLDQKVLSTKITCAYGPTAGGIHQAGRSDASC